MTTEATVFIVDDDQATRESVGALVAPMGVMTQLFCSAEDFLAVYDPARPGCLVTDLRMRGMGGLELQEKLNELGIHIPTIVMSGYADVPVTVQAMQQGALTLLEKPCRDMQLWDAIREALALDVTWREQTALRRDIQGRIDSLTDQERQIMELVVAGLANKVIADRLDVSLRTVEGRRKSVFGAMGTDSVAGLVQLVITARGGPATAIE